MRFATPLADLTEKEWMAQGAELARTLGWLRFHPFRSDRSEPGWPDDALVRERLVFVEWKRETGKLSPHQKRWITSLLDAAQEVYVARPRDLDDLAKILAHRGDPWHARGPIAVTASVLRATTRAEAA